MSYDKSFFENMKGSEMVIRKATMKDVDSIRPLYLELEKDAVRFQPEHFVIGNRDTSFFKTSFKRKTRIF